MDGYIVLHAWCMRRFFLSRFVSFLFFFCSFHPSPPLPFPALIRLCQTEPKGFNSQLKARRPGDQSPELSGRWERVRSVSVQSSPVQACVSFFSLSVGLLPARGNTPQKKLIEAGTAGTKLVSRHDETFPCAAFCVYVYVCMGDIVIVSGNTTAGMDGRV